MHWEGEKDAYLIEGNCTCDSSINWGIHDCFSTVRFCHEEESNLYTQQDTSEPADVSSRIAHLLSAFWNAQHLRPKPLLPGTGSILPSQVALLPKQKDSDKTKLVRTKTHRFFHRSDIRLATSTDRTNDSRLFWICSRVSHYSLTRRTRPPQERFLTHTKTHRFPSNRYQPNTITIMWRLHRMVIAFAGWILLTSVVKAQHGYLQAHALSSTWENTIPLVDHSSYHGLRGGGQHGRSSVWDVQIPIIHYTDDNKGNDKAEEDQQWMWLRNMPFFLIRENLYSTSRGSAFCWSFSVVEPLMTYWRRAA